MTTVFRQINWSRRGAMAARSKAGASSCSAICATWRQRAGESTTSQLRAPRRATDWRRAIRGFGCISLTLQRIEFARAAALVGLPVEKVQSSSSGRDPAVRRAVSDAPGYSLALATHGHEHRCLLRFEYRDKPRVVASDGIWLRDGRWYLVGREVAAEIPPDDWETKNFRLDRMSGLALDRPGTAPAALGAPELNIDPLTFRQGDPIEAVVATHPDSRARVEARLGTASSVRRTREMVELTIPVTNRTTFRNRLYELDTRVRLLGPPELRAEVRDDLRAHLRAED